MKERPIIMTGESVVGIQEDRKTQTRRVAKVLLPADKQYIHAASHEEWVAKRILQCPYGRPGDRLWLRESLVRNDKFLGTIAYAADGKRCTNPNATDNLDGWSLWKFPRPSVPSIHMPRWAARLTLELTEIRV